MIIICSSRGSDPYHRFVACNICPSPIGLLISWHYRRVIKTHISFTQVNQPVKNEQLSKSNNTKQVERVEELGAINQYLCLSCCIYFRHKPCPFSIFCFYFVFIICLVQDMYERKKNGSKTRKVKMDQKPKTSGSKILLKANRTPIWTQVSFPLSLYLSLFFSFTLFSLSVFMCCQF